MPVPSRFGVLASGHHGGGGGATTLNPLDCSTSLSLSSGNLTATRNLVTNGRWVSARATTSKSTTKRYFEATATNPETALAVGLANAAFVIDNGGQNVVGFDGAGNSIGYDATGLIAIAGTSTVSASAWFSPGDVAQVAVDLGARLFWGRANGGQWNGSPTANPATGVGGISMTGAISTGALFPAVSAFDPGPPADTITINFGATTFSGSIPAGFSAWG
jgi:hypothetical protein